VGKRIAQRLEGSRFAAWQVCRLAAGGSRELPLWQPKTQRFVRRAYSHEAPQNQEPIRALGHFREPLVKQPPDLRPTKRLPSSARPATHPVQAAIGVLYEREHVFAVLILRYEHQEEIRLQYHINGSLRLHDAIYTKCNRC